jgi:sulfide dehydrogenase cytochrome subunit
MKNILTCSALLVLTMAFSAQAQESLPNDQMQKIGEQELQFLVKECESCHGKGGVSTNDAIPSLAGRSAESILESVEQFYFYERHCPNAKNGGEGPKSGARNMCDVADRLTKQEVLAIGAYFESK